jgi:Outer membrane protein transport protein (OMPP1/FadL/TodX)
MSPRPFRPVVALLSLGLVGVTGSASANPLDTFGFGSRESAMAGAMVADTHSFAANYYNPAGLVSAPGTELAIGYFHTSQRLKINGRDNGVDPVRGVIGGIVAPGKLLGVPFAFGVAVHLPDDRLSRVHSLKDETPRWEMYDNRSQLLFIATNLAVRPVSWLDIGGGVAYLAATTARMDISGTAVIPPGDPYDSQLRHEVDGDLTTVRFPIAGLRVHLSDDLKIGMAYRGESKLDLKFGAYLHGEVDYSGIRVPATYVLESQTFDVFHPRQAVLGASYQVTPRLRTNLDLTWVDWSAYERPISNSRTELTVEIEDLPLDIPPSPKPTVGEDPRFEDRILPRLAVEFLTVAEEHVEVPVRVGYIFERSPVPEQSGNTNSVDTDRHVISAGVGLRLVNPVDLLPGDLRLDVHGAYAILPERETYKSNPADFVGDYKASGRMLTLGATLALGFDQ